MKWNHLWREEPGHTQRATAMWSQRLSPGEASWVLVSAAPHHSPTSTKVEVGGSSGKPAAGLPSSITLFQSWSPSLLFSAVLLEASLFKPPPTPHAPSHQPTSDEMRNLVSKAAVQDSRRKE